MIVDFDVQPESVRTEFLERPANQQGPGFNRLRP
mgnify:CR=1 FL=1